MNYRRTAEKLNMTQPGVTQHIHYLEKHYGVKLFEYDGRILSRTKNAEYLKRHFDSIKAEEKALAESFVNSDMIVRKSSYPKELDYEKKTLDFLCFGGILHYRALPVDQIYI